MAIGTHGNVFHEMLAAFHLGLEGGIVDGYGGAGGSFTLRGHNGGCSQGCETEGKGKGEFLHF
jgi:hypothetical protein